MQKIAFAALLSVFAAAWFVGPAMAYTPASCSDAGAYCMKPRGNAPCGSKCRAYCNAEVASCKKTGRFNTANHSWSGIPRN